MALAYAIKDQFGLHFVTFTVHQRADVFTRRDYADIVINSLKFCCSTCSAGHVELREKGRL